MDHQKPKKHVRRRWGRIVIKTFLFLVLFVLVLALLIQLPPVQNIFRKKAVAWLERKLQTKVRVGSAYVEYPGKIRLQDVYIEDRQGDTLLSGGVLKMNMSLPKLMFRNDPDFKNIELENMTVKVSRQLPDTVFNFQFVIDAFSTPNKSPNLDDSTSFSLSVPSVVLNKVRLVYKDVITGSDMQAWINHLDTRIEKLDIENLVIDLPHTNIDGFTANIYQIKPLATSEPLSKDVTEAKKPSKMKLDLKQIHLKNIRLDYRNDVSATYTTFNIPSLTAIPQKLDISNREIIFDSLSLANSTIAMRFGKKEQARVAVKEVKQEIKSQAEAGWRMQAKVVDLVNNAVRFENDNKPRAATGIDYAHLKADSFTLLVNDFILDSDSIGGRIQKGQFREQSGFVLEQLQGEVLYADQQAYLKDLLLKTPGTEIKRYALLTYTSQRALGDSFSRTMMDVDISDSYVQVKDILAFAPALSHKPAFANPEAIWYLNLQGSGTLESMYIANLQFRGFKNTTIDAAGSLATNNDPNRAGGRLTIRKLHTTQSDIALFTGRRLSNEQINFPEELDATGTLAGSFKDLHADLNISTSAGSAYVNGRFTNLADPRNAGYNTVLRTHSLNIGQIMRNPQLGFMSADLVLNGKGFTQDAMDTKFKGSIHSIGIGDYVYRNIVLNGNVHQTAYTLNTTIRDPNLGLQGTASGDFSANASLRFIGMVDSLKAMPLRLSTQPLVFRGKVDADITSMTADRLDANIMVTQALFVSSSQRLPLDTILFVSGTNENGQFMRLTSDVANANISGQYRYTDLGNIFLNSIQPYFSVTPAAVAHVQPYNFSFTIDVANAPALAALVPGLKSFKPVHAEGTIATGQGLNGKLITDFISYQGNDISGLNLNVNTTPAGLQFTADMQRLKGGTLDLYHTQLRATALNNRLDFNLNVDDSRGKDKYILAGLLSQPSPGTYTLNLRSDSLMLNYQVWAVSPGNSLTITRDNIIANNFTLQRNDQRVSLQTVSNHLNADFSNFQLSTITAFMQSDSLLVNGSVNGTMSFRNILKQPLFTADLNIHDLSIRGDTLGNALVKIDNLSGDRYNTNATITGRGNDFALTGSFAPSGDHDIALDLQLAIRQMQLNTVEGALGGFLKNASGSVNGNISIRGTTSQPVINGPINFNNASFALNFLGSQFKVDGEKLMLTENGFSFDDFLIRDTAGNIMRLNGVVQTRNFSNYHFDLDLYTDHFRILHTTKKETKIYYGDLVISSELHVGGTEINPVVDGNIVVNDGTKLSLVVPQREQGVVQREGIVEFVDMDNPGADTLFKAYDSLNTFGITGMNITTNIEIQKEAVFNIIIDEANGDFINLQGTALLSTGIDPSGKTTLVGTYELEKGAYEITFNFLHRRFDIQKGSRIVWLNEPTKAIMDVSAVYIANTSPIDLVQNQIAASTMAIRNTYLQKLPFEVHLKMTGELLEPQVAFDIILPENKSYGVSNDIITQVDTRLAQLRQDPGEINKQVFSLLLLNRFIGENPLESSAPGFSATTYVRQSVSKLLTSQLNKLAAGLIDGVDITFDVTSTDDYTTGSRRSRTDLDIGLSKRLLNERLTVTVGSNFELEGPKNSSQQANNIIGNLSVNYALSRDGRYMLRFYRKNEYEGIVDGYIVESGLSFIISVDYNKVRELLFRRKQKVEEGVR